MIFVEKYMGIQYQFIIICTFGSLDKAGRVLLLSPFFRFQNIPISLSDFYLIQGRLLKWMEHWILTVST